MNDNKIIAIETSGNICSVSLLDDMKVLCEYSVFKGNKHDKLCAEFIRRILIDNDLKLEDINAIALSNGPGSFTGLRIGAAVAKGLTINNIPKLISVPTLSAMAYNSRNLCKENKAINSILAVIPSHANLFYIQEFDLNINEKDSIAMIDYDTLNSKLKDEIFIISNSPIFEDSLNFKYSPLTASIIGNYAYELYNKGIFTDSSMLVPIYVQDFIPKK